MVCLKHHIELPLRHLFMNLDGTTTISAIKAKLDEAKDNVNEFQLWGVGSSIFSISILEKSCFRIEKIEKIEKWTSLSLQVTKSYTS